MFGPEGLFIKWIVPGLPFLHQLFNVSTTLLSIEGCNQGWNLNKQKYEILNGHIRIVAKNVI